MALILLFGTPTAYWIATRVDALRDVVVTLIELPLVLPPAVAGIGLLAAFGRLGLLGGTFDALGIDIAFTQTAVVLAVTFVASPFYVRTAIAAFEAVDPTLPAAARTLGAGPGARLLARDRCRSPRGGLGAGAALAFARGIGEFGATIMFAGSLQGVTQTLSLAIYEQFDLDFDVALAISAVLVVDQRASSSSPSSSSPDGAPASTSPIPFAPSTRRRADASSAGETVALVGPVGGGQDDGAARRRRTAAARPRARRASTARRGSTRRRGSTVPPEQRRVGYLFQEYALFPHLDVARERPLRRVRGGDVDELLERFRIAHLAQARVRELSGGERQRVALARALAREPGGAPARRAALGARRAHARRRSAPSSTSCSASSGCRRSSSRTTSRTRRRSPTGSA